MLQVDGASDDEKQKKSEGDHLTVAQKDKVEPKTSGKDIKTGDRVAWPDAKRRKRENVGSCPEKEVDHSGETTTGLFSCFSH